MFLRIELPSLLSCGNFAVYMHESQLDASETSQFVHNVTFIRPLNSSWEECSENGDTWDLKKPGKAGRNGKMMAKPSWVK